MTLPHTADWKRDIGLLRAANPIGVLFLCVGNSARSQMAEGLARHLAPPGTAIWSAGSEPGALNPLAVRVMAEIGLDISDHVAKGLDAVPQDRVDAVITLCAEEICPVWVGRVVRVHWSFPDPGVAAEAERLDAFRNVRDALLVRLGAWFKG
jgi:protein-tyrosine-phosphatase